MQKYIATYVDRGKVTDTIEIEANNKLQAGTVARFHKRTRGISGKILIELKK
ncbi:MAG: hypothetical protein JWQ09_4412 [Segetibacter sp.]|nr:hypothetical protein [Segetibacter sp.]